MSAYLTLNCIQDLHVTLVHIEAVSGNSPTNPLFIAQCHLALNIIQEESLYVDHVFIYIAFLTRVRLTYFFFLKKKANRDN